MSEDTTFGLPTHHFSKYYGNKESHRSRRHIMSKIKTLTVCQ